MSIDTNAILDELEILFPQAQCELVHRNPFELLVAVVLSAQATDSSVNRVTPALFAKYPTPQAMAAASVDEISSYIKSIGLYRNKARSLKALSESLVSQFDGVVPSSRKELMSLAGVGRKRRQTWYAASLLISPASRSIHMWSVFPNGLD